MECARREIKYKKNCTVCGKEFDAYTKNQKFCSPECKKESDRINNQWYRQKQAEERKKRQEQIKRKKAVADIAAEARKAGMSYGKYVALHKL